MRPPELVSGTEAGADAFDDTPDLIGSEDRFPPCLEIVDRERHDEPRTSGVAVEDGHDVGMLDVGGDVQLASHARRGLFDVRVADAFEGDAKTGRLVRRAEDVSLAPVPSGARSSA
jgi:hypothetical protein